MQQQIEKYLRDKFNADPSQRIHTERNCCSRVPDHGSSPGCTNYRGTVILYSCKKSIFILKYYISCRNLGIKQGGFQ